MTKCKCTRERQKGSKFCEPCANSHKNKICEILNCFQVVKAENWTICKHHGDKWWDVSGSYKNWIGQYE